MKKKLRDYHFNKHSCFLLQYHLVLVTKYRKEVFIDKMENYLTDFVNSTMSKNDCNLIEINYDKNHVHILFEIPVTLNLLNFINSMKSISSWMIKKRFEKHLKQFYWKNVFWLRSYFIYIVSEHTTILLKIILKIKEKIETIHLHL